MTVVSFTPWSLYILGKRPLERRLGRPLSHFEQGNMFLSEWEKAG
jgi:hypothetical protein